MDVGGESGLAQEKSVVFAAADHKVDRDAVPDENPKKISFAESSPTRPSAVDVAESGPKEPVYETVEVQHNEPWQHQEAQSDLRSIYPQSSVGFRSSSRPFDAQTTR